ncbi:MAG: Glutamate/gamma-aminobutyrate antiporter [Candidatus Anoxychlamydiales bacterium]|nr:Glutamate/gamma-aminobutyrate antiporter [Candidatus Anoxychlamydiales bacterium]NGX36203.1 Glutamate/gamma-aminobutyrate antiporter [Candidatus Anoxychlamydiales bacterium]
MFTKRRTINVFMLAMINVAALVNIANISVSAKYGFTSIFFIIVASIVFFIPIAMISAELATGWPERGGVYIWVKEALGDNFGFLAIWLQWIENVIWYPTALSFAAVSFAYIFNPALAQNKIYIMSTIIIVFWLSTLVNFFGMTISGWISTLCAIFGTILPGILIIVLGGLWLFLGNPSNITFSTKTFFPDFTSLSQFALLSGVLMSLSGLEMSAVHAREVKNPSKNYPISILISAIIIISILSFGSLAIATIIPSSSIELPAGAIEAISSVFKVYNFPKLTSVVAFFITLGALGMISTWTIGPIKGIYATAEHGDLPIILQKLNKHQAPVNLLVLQAIIVTILAFVFLLTPTITSSYWILLNLTAHLYQIMYVLMFISAIVLRYKKPKVERAYKIPFKNVGMWIVGSVGIIGTTAAIIIGYFPPTQITGFNPVFYEIFLIGGTILFCIIPFIIRYFRKPEWHLEHKKIANKK